MSNLQQRAGQSTREMAAKRYKNRVKYVFVTAGVIFLIILVIYNSDALGIGVFGSLGLMLVARIIMNITGRTTQKMVREERRAVRGARGEEKIGSILDNLGPDYMVLHDIESPYGNIDHIVVGKNGIFLIETKAHGGKVTASSGHFLVNGRKPEKDFITQALSNAYWFRKKIGKVLGVEVWITPIVVFTNAFVERFAPIKGVIVVNKKFLLNILQRPNLKLENSAIWEHREKIVAAIYGKQVSIQTSPK